MNRTLVLPVEFESKLMEASTRDEIHSKWLLIGVVTLQDMIHKIISKLNERYPKLRITNYRTESKENIKEIIGNRGSHSIYSGYFETNEGNVDGLFFYIPPFLNTGNDFLTRQVMPSLMGIYGGISQQMIDLHFNNRPVYIININETNRSEQRAVKISFICAEILGFKYVDIFEREYLDIMENTILEDKEVQMLSLIEFNQLFTSNGDNELFKVNTVDKVLELLPNRIVVSSNQSAEMYRYSLKVLPAIYLAIDAGYQVNIDAFNALNISMFNIIRTYVAKI